MNTMYFTEEHELFRKSFQDFLQKEVVPHIDKWEKWSKDICNLIKEVDYAFLDGTFYRNGELKRDMSEIPHPFVEESMSLFKDLSVSDKKKIHFIHFNHTNNFTILSEIDVGAWKIHTLDDPPSSWCSFLTHPSCVIK